MNESIGQRFYSMLDVSAKGLAGELLVEVFSEDGPDVVMFKDGRIVFSAKPPSWTAHDVSLVDRLTPVLQHVLKEDDWLVGKGYFIFSEPQIDNIVAGKEPGPSGRKPMADHYSVGGVGGTLATAPSAASQRGTE